MNTTQTPTFMSAWPVPAAIRERLVQASEIPDQLEKLATIDAIVAEARARYPQCFQTESN